MKPSYYITTTLPYVNADPHIGFAWEIIQADVLARYHRLLGEDVVFNTGTDEHGLKIYRKAIEQGIDPQTYCDEYAARFGELKSALNLSYTNFIRTTDPEHCAAAQEFWKLCLAKGDIYKKKYKIKYCVGCELEKTDSELVDDHCPTHPNLNLEFIDEENYFFRFSQYQTALLELYENQPDFVVPANRLQEIKKFVERGLEDFSISRLKTKMPWGVPVPNDPEQVLYVWFDALVNYISTLGWPLDYAQGKTENNFAKFWPGVQVAGKDNLRQQAAMWQAMLLSAELPTSKQIFIHGFITADGEKMSKSLGNVINPLDLVTKFSSLGSVQIGTDALRYYLLGAMPAYDDGDFSEERFKEYYTAHLVNGIGNLTSRILTMIEKYCENKIHGTAEDIFDVKLFWEEYEKNISNYAFDAVVAGINNFVSRVDALISQQKPWEKVKQGENIQELIYQLAEGLRHVAISLLPIIPETGSKILTQLNMAVKDHLNIQKKWGGLPAEILIKKGEILFPRL